LTGPGRPAAFRAAGPLGGKEVKIMVPRNGGPMKWGLDLSESLRRKGIVNNCVHTTGRLLAAPFSNGADIVHTVIPVPYRLWREPVVLTIKGDYRREKRIWRRPYDVAIRKASAITVPSDYLKNRLDIPEGAVVIPNAVFHEMYREFVKLDFCREDRDLEVVTATRFFFPGKAGGVVKLVEILDGTGYIKGLTVFGGGPLLRDVRSRVEKLGPGMDVDFRGEVPRPYRYFRDFDAFLYNSDHDNFPIVLLEAMACGMPVLTNDTGAVKEFIDDGKTGLVAESEEEYGKRIEHISDTGKSRGLGAAARESVEKNYSWDNIVERYIEIYESVS